MHFFQLCVLCLVDDSSRDDVTPSRLFENTKLDYLHVPRAQSALGEHERQL